MTIGFSIQNPAFSGGREDLLAGHESLEAFLVALNARGVQSIEIRKLASVIDEETYEAINRSVQMIWDMGMEVTIHGEITKDRAHAQTFSELYPSMAYILEHFRKYQDGLVMTLHALQEERGKTAFTADELAQQTVSILRNWTEIVEKENLPICFALENNRSKEKKVDPGNACRNVLAMVEQVDSPKLGICWDMSHYHSNLILGTEADRKLGDLPPAAFLERAVHTHIHGLTDSGKTHFPITDAFILPLEAYLNALQKAGYEGVHNLELTFNRFEKDLPVAENVFLSIERLQAYEAQMSLVN